MTKNDNNLHITALVRDDKKFYIDYCLQNATTVQQQGPKLFLVCGELPLERKKSLKLMRKDNNVEHWEISTNLSQINTNKY